MAADKKIERDRLPHPEKEDKKNKSQEEFDAKSKTDKDKPKSKKVNYVVKGFTYILSTKPDCGIRVYALYGGPLQ